MRLCGFLVLLVSIVHTTPFYRSMHPTAKSTKPQISVRVRQVLSYQHRCQDDIQWSEVETLHSPHQHSLLKSREMQSYRNRR